MLIERLEAHFRVGMAGGMRAADTIRRIRGLQTVRYSVDFSIKLACDA